jgi:hypothetical protein
VYALEFIICVQTCRSIGLQVCTCVHIHTHTGRDTSRFLFIILMFVLRVFGRAARQCTGAPGQPFPRTREFARGVVTAGRRRGSAAAMGAGELRWAIPESPPLLFGQWPALANLPGCCWPGIQQLPSKPSCGSRACFFINGAQSTNRTEYTCLGSSLLTLVSATAAPTMNLELRTLTLRRDNASKT